MPQLDLTSLKHGSQVLAEVVFSINLEKGGTKEVRLEDWFSVTNIDSYAKILRVEVWVNSSIEESYPELLEVQVPFNKIQKIDNTYVNDSRNS